MIRTGESTLKLLLTQLGLIKGLVNKSRRNQEKNETGYRQLDRNHQDRLDHRSP